MGEKVPPLGRNREVGGGWAPLYCCRGKGTLKYEGQTGWKLHTYDLGQKYQGVLEPKGSCILRGTKLEAIFSSPLGCLSHLSLCSVVTILQVTLLMSTPLAGTAWQLAQLVPKLTAKRTEFCDNLLSILFFLFIYKPTVALKK